ASQDPMLHLFLFAALSPQLPLPAPSVPVRLPQSPQITPDGQRIVFVWQKDLWIVPAAGGKAERLTNYPGTEDFPVLSKDGKQVAFRANFDGENRLYRLPLDGGPLVQISHHSRRDRAIGWSADGSELYVLRATDRGFHRSETYRVFAIDLEGKRPARMLLDVGVVDAAVAPDGRHLLFTRGAASWTRKGYQGAAALQLWHADLTGEEPVLVRIDADREDFQNVSRMDPAWTADGQGWYYTSDPDGTFDLFLQRGADAEPERVTDLRKLDGRDDGAAFAAYSATGRFGVFRRGFDLMRVDLPGGQPQPVVIWVEPGEAAPSTERVREERATDVAFTADGKQFAFVAAEDLYAGDRILGEPVRITHTPHLEENLLFSQDGKRLFFTSDSGGEVDIWSVRPAREDGIWWLDQDFVIEQLTDDPAVEDSLLLDPTGAHIAYRRDNDLWVMDADGSDARRVVPSWDRIEFDWSPDGRWLVYATEDSDYNSDVYILPIDGTREPFNLSRHPDWDSEPRWSPDGERIAWVGRRDGEESDVYYVNLTRSVEENTERDRKLEEAMKAMEPKGKGKEAKGKKAEGEPAAGEGDAKDAAKEGEGAKADNRKEEAKGPKPIEIEFEGLHERLHRISVSDSREGNLLWSPDGKRLGFSATIDGSRGFYTVSFPKVESPKRMAASVPDRARWLADSKEIVGLSSGKPAAMDEKGKVDTFQSTVRTVRDWAALRQAAFDQAWRQMRDRFYDERMNGRDWQRIRARYRPVAAECIGAVEFTHLVNMMLGELNASHMGHNMGPDPLPESKPVDDWQPSTYELGLRFALRDAGPGLLVDSVILAAPATGAVRGSWPANGCSPSMARPSAPMSTSIRS
ncbi:MAG: hypothetical protein R3E96_14495, partial [Planctomycetota bacterium]